jgi:hypothetical protein
MTTPPPHISAEERDALYALIVSRLTGLPDVLLAIEAEDWVASERLSVEFAAYLRLLQDLGWGDEGTGAVLTTPPDLLRRALLQLKECAEMEDRGEAEERKELAEHENRNQLVRKVCAQHLADLEGFTS